MSFQEFLNWLTSPDGGAFLVISWAAAWGLESFSFWEELGTKAKSLSVLGVAVAVGILGTWLKTQPEFIAMIDPYFTTVSYIVIVWLSTQTAHRVNNLRKKSLHK